MTPCTEASGSPQGHVHVSTADGVATVTLDAPERRNALDIEMARELVAACDEVDADGRIGAVVIRGAGGYFCAGAHRDLLAAAADDPAAESAFDSITAVYGAFTRIAEMHVPSIAAVRGGAVGAGVNLLLAATLRVVSRDSRLVPGFATLGLHPGGGHMALLNRLGGHEAAAALGVFGQPITGERAARLGIAWEATSDASVESRAHEIASVAGADPVLSRMTVESLKNEVGPPPVSLATALAVERAAQMRSQRRLGERRSGHLRPPE